jgi:amidophosphoribosyltransferase
MHDHPRHYCGVFGIFGHPNAAELTYYGLYALQHRGQESAGIVSSDGHQFRVHRGMGLVSQIFDGDILKQLVGTAAVGHTRYSTTGSSHLRNAQPLTVDCAKGQIAIAHNGNLTNAAAPARGTRSARLDLPDHGGQRDHPPPHGPAQPEWPWQ